MKQARTAFLVAIAALLATAALPVRADEQFTQQNFGEFLVDVPRHWPVMHEQQQSGPDRIKARDAGIGGTLYVANQYGKDGAVRATLKLGITYGPNFSQREVAEAASTPKKGVEKALDRIEVLVVAAFPEKAEVIRRSIDTRGHAACFLFQLAVHAKDGDRTGYTWWCPADDRAAIFTAVYDPRDDAALFPTVLAMRNSLSMTVDDAKTAPPATVADELAAAPATMLDLGMYRLDVVSRQLDFSAQGLGEFTSGVTYPEVFERYLSAGPLIALRLGFQAKEGQLKDGSPEKACAAVVNAARTQFRTRLPAPGKMFLHFGRTDGPASDVPARAEQEIIIEATLETSGNGKPPFEKTVCEGSLAGFEVLKD